MSLSYDEMLQTLVLGHILLEDGLVCPSGVEISRWPTIASLGENSMPLW